MRVAGGTLRSTNGFPNSAKNCAFAMATVRLATWLMQLARTDVLLLDDWGMAGIDAHTRADLLKIIDGRAVNKSTIITRQ